MASGKVTDMQTELTRLDGLKKEVQGETSSRGRIRVQIEHNQYNDQLDEILEKIVKARLKQLFGGESFPKLEKIRKGMGVILKEDMCGIRLLFQVNGGLDDMYNSLLLNYV